MLQKIKRAFYVLYKKATLALLIRKDSKNILPELSTDKKALFIDCGSNVGQAFSYFRKFFPLSHFDYVLIEPNPFCVEELKENLGENFERVEFIQAAAAKEDSQTKFFGLVEGKGVKTSQGGSVLKDHNSRYYQPDENGAITVDTFSFTEFLKDKSQFYETIIIKMDIEGGEYDVLEDMIEKGVFLLADKVYVEFHSSFMTEPNKSRYQEKEQKILSAFESAGRPVTVWI